MALPNTSTPTLPTDNPAETRRARWRSEPLWALVAALVVGLLYGRVGVTHLGTGLVGGNSNGYENVWNDWWFREALAHLKNPFYTTRIFYPNGVSLRYHTLNPLGGLLALPLGGALRPRGGDEPEVSRRDHRSDLLRVAVVPRRGGQRPGGVRGCGDVRTRQ